ncbi:MAG: thiamine phosphate synthase [Bacteroidetes bacterium]|nr:thiamine phosphate synthase [Bacteroidota bacterium]
MKLILISSSSGIEKEVEILTSLFEKGLQTLHLRKPKYSTPKLRKFLQSIPSKYHNRIIIHSHHNLALKFDLKGIHLTKSHKRRRLKTWFTLMMIRRRKPGILVTTSYTKLGNILEAEKQYNYVFLSPIFDSSTSKYQAGFTEHSLIGTLKKTPYKVIARGGVDVDHIAKVQEIGFYGLAIHSSIWNIDDPVTEFESYINKFKELGIPAE